MKIRFGLNDDLPLGKISSIPSVIVFVKSVFKKATDIIYRFIYMNVGMNFSADHKKYAVLVQYAKYY